LKSLLACSSSSIQRIVAIGLRCPFSRKYDRAHIRLIQQLQYPFFPRYNMLIIYPVPCLNLDNPTGQSSSWFCPQHFFVSSDQIGHIAQRESRPFEEPIRPLHLPSVPFYNTPPLRGPYAPHLSPLSSLPRSNQ
jgi:hypothetical protein